MGISASKRVKNGLSNSTPFDSACDSAFDHCISLAQHAFPGVLPYQLLTAAELIHRDLSSLRVPLILKWLPNPPSRARVDYALRVVTRRDGGVSALERDEFKEWALEVFADCVVGNALKAVASRIPIGIAGIAGIGAVTRSARDLVGAAIGVYALGVATSVYLSLSG